MSIYVVTGTPGGGKTYRCTRQVLRGIERGVGTITNVLLEDGWEYVLAKSNPFRRLMPGRVDKRAAQFRRRYYYTASLDDLIRVRVPGCGACKPCKRRRAEDLDLYYDGCKKEGRARVLLDEGHLWMNARAWNIDDTGRGLNGAQATQRRLGLVEWAAQHRKLGLDVEIVTQDADMIDAQIRRLAAYVVRVKNLRQYRIPIVGIRLCPVNIFVAVTAWSEAEKATVGTEVYLLNRRWAKLYDSMALHDGYASKLRDEPIWLGRTGPAAGEAQPARPEPDAARVAALVASLDVVRAAVGPPRAPAFAVGPSNSRSGAKFGTYLRDIWASQRA